jgi:hypothetical protein
MIIINGQAGLVKIPGLKKFIDQGMGILPHLGYYKMAIGAVLQIRRNDVI